MGLYQSEHPDLPKMKGLHLFHFVMSNCSQRVRLGLEEKGVDWTSHHLDLPNNAHVSADYQRINPNGVVPTLVHDGQVVLESNDILVYLDEHFPDPPLRPSESLARAAMDARISDSSGFQSVIKVLSHELLFRPFRKIGSEEIELYERDHNDPVLVAWLRDYAEAGPAWESRVREANEGLESGLRTLETSLEKSEWLSGDRYGLADISWAVNYHRLNQAKVDFSPWPRWAKWGERATKRPAFQAAVVHYVP
jgi:glutathione S-transferase